MNLKTIQNHDFQVRLFQEVQDHNLDRLMQLLKRYSVKASEKIYDENGNSLLSIAVQINDKKIVKQLLLIGLDPNTQNNDGNTPLHFALSGRYMRIADLLLMNGADERIENNDGVEPWELMEGRAFQYATD